MSMAVAAMFASCSADSDKATHRAPLPMLADAGVSTASNGSELQGIENPGELVTPMPNVSAAADDDAGHRDAAAPVAPVTSSNSCAVSKTGAQLEPVNMFVMIDRSGSMDNENKWI